MNNLETRLTRKDAAKFLTDHGYPVTAETLAAKASRGGGPEFVVFGHTSFYWEADLLSWAESRVQRRGGQPAQPPRQKQAA
jgi:hypothetical protein